MEQLEEALLKHIEEQKEYWLNEVHSIEGEPTNIDSMGSSYKCYSQTIEFDILDDSLGEILEGLDEMVKRLIGAAIELKSFEKPEGEAVKNRCSVIHWRQYPLYRHKGGEITVSIRISCHHAETPTEGYK